MIQNVLFSVPSGSEMVHSDSSWGYSSTMKLTAYLHLVLRLRMTEAIPPLPHTLS